jgi:hypothetical protein
MKLFSRRKTFAVAAAAPIAAGMSAKNYGVDPVVPTTPPPGGWAMNDAASTLTRIDTPPKWRDFCNARDAFHQSQMQRHEVHNPHIFDLNIQALRSVSPQHKAHMQMEDHRRRNREAESFLESLARNLGVLEFWKGRDEGSRNYQDTAQSSRY